jgi:transcriptional regulator with XRE-family HTH domain
MSKKKITPQISEASQRILAFRKSLKLNMEDFASKAGVGRVTVLYWENGHSKPSPEAYVRMANLAKESDIPSAVWFLRQAGVDLETLRDLLPEFDKSAKKAEQRVREVTEHQAGSTVAVPLLRENASITEPTLASDDQVEAWFSLPALLVPNPSKTSCLRAPKRMASLGHGGKDFLVIDSSVTLIEKLEGKMVIAIHQSTGDWFAGFLQHFDFDDRKIPALTTGQTVPFYRNRVAAFPIKAARKTEDASRKTEDMEKAGCGVLGSPGPFRAMTPKNDWTIKGRVICRIGCEPGIDFGRLARRDSAVIEPAS